MAVGARALATTGARLTLGPGADERQVRRLVLLRFYGRELGEERAAAIFDAIEARRTSR